MKTKFNLHFFVPGSQMEHGSIIQRDLKSEINTLLASSADQFANFDLESLYIGNPEMEDSLAKYKSHTDENNVCIVEGRSGCGKSTLVRHVFGTGMVSAQISGFNLIIPFDVRETPCDGIESTFIAKLNGACYELKKQFPELLDSDAHPDKFYDFVHKTAPESLYAEDKYPAPPPIGQLQAFHDSDLFQFRCTEMKFYLSQRDEVQIDNVIILVDGIEGMSRNPADISFTDEERACLAPIKMLIRLIEILESMPDAPVPWSVNAVICCGHDVSHMMGRLSYTNTRLETYSYRDKLEGNGKRRLERLDFEQSASVPTIMDIIQKRYEALCNNGANRLNGDWKSAMETALEILKNIDGKLGPFILDLTLSNKGKAMEQMKNLAFNRQWLQVGNAQSAPYGFSKNDFHLTSASLLRAIGMNESKVYNPRNLRTSIIPNLLYNDPNEKTELFVLLSLRYFLRASSKPSDWQVAPVRLDDFFQRTSRLFRCNDYTRHFRESVRYLLENRLLLRSYDQEQSDGRALPDEYLDAIEHIYISKLAENMWGKLAESSLLFEMFIDDVWLEHESSRKLAVSDIHGFSAEHFQVCIDYMGDVLIGAEREIFCRAANVNAEDAFFKELFRDEPICSHLLKGLRNSFDNFYRRKPLTANERAAWSKALQELKPKCEAIYDNGD